MICHASRPKDKIIFSSPQDYRHEWPRVDIHQTTSQNELKHIRLIKPMQHQYFLRKGLCCNFCGQLTRGKSYRHRCSSFADKNCKNCNRFILELRTYIVTQMGLQSFKNLI